MPGKSKEQCKHGPAEAAKHDDVLAINAVSKHASEGREERLRTRCFDQRFKR